MSRVPSYPKIFALGNKHIVDIWDGKEVFIEEKLDGSQIGFGVIDGRLCVRSKNVQLDLENVDKMFSDGVEYIKSIEDKLQECNNIIFYAEYMQRPKHHTIAYDRIPKNHLMLFGVCTILENDYVSKRIDLESWADYLDIEPAPLLYCINYKPDIEQLNNVLEDDSRFGGSKIEGIVVKNYSKEHFVGGMLLPFLAGKYVSEEFKEVNKHNWKVKHTNKGKLQEFFEQFQTEARWNKAVQHLKEKGELEQSPRDIGKLFKEVNIDIEEEEKERIKEGLWKIHKRDLLKTATRGLAEWYKQKLMEEPY